MSYLFLLSLTICSNAWICTDDTNSMWKSFKSDPASSSSWHISLWSAMIARNSAVLSLSSQYLRLFLYLAFNWSLLTFVLISHKENSIDSKIVLYNIVFLLSSTSFILARFFALIYQDSHSWTAVITSLLKNLVFGVESIFAHDNINRTNNISSLCFLLKSIIQAEILIYV